MWRNLFNRTRDSMATWPDAILTLALLGAAGTLVYIALRPNKKLLKAATLAYVVLP